jgi:hypothetical protein
MAIKFPKNPDKRAAIPIVFNTGTDFEELNTSLNPEKPCLPITAEKVGTNTIIKEGISIKDKIFEPIKMKPMMQKMKRKIPSIFI